MEDIVALCPRVMVLGHGRKLFDGALPDLLGRYDTLRTVTVNYEEPEAVPELPASIPLARDGKNLTISYSPQEYATAELIGRLQAALLPFAPELRDVTVDYGEGPVFAPVSFTIRAGDRLDLSGPNGAGKTSLLRLLTGEAAPASGSGSPLRLTRIVSPIPSASSAPIPIALFTVPCPGRPASVTPRCSG